MSKKKTFQECLDAAKKCKTLKEFISTYNSIYVICKRNKWFDEIDSIVKFERTEKPKGFWTIENIKIEALKYKHKNEFYTNSNGAWDAANRLGIVDEVCSHMEALGNIRKRGIYAIEFSDKSVYVGLTHDYKERYKDHLKNTKQIIQKLQNTTHVLVTFNVFYDINIAGIKEKEKMEEYKNNGWTLINIAPGGSLGACPPIYSDQQLMEIALKYNKKSEFLKLDKNAYQTAYRRKILDNICTHMKRNEYKKRLNN